MFIVQMTDEMIVSMQASQPEGLEEGKIWLICDTIGGCGISNSRTERKKDAAQCHVLIRNSGFYQLCELLWYLIDVRI